LCGPLLRPLARRLVGVDLSPKMLSKAAARGVYDQLNCGELSAWLASCGQRFEVAVAADVLCYFGDLSAVFAQIRAVLMPGGCFACSLEASSEPGSGAPFVLRPHGRYQHDRGYVEVMLTAAGFVAVRLTQAILRYEISCSRAVHQSAGSGRALREPCRQKLFAPSSIHFWMVARFALPPSAPPPWVFGQVCCAQQSSALLETVPRLTNAYDTDWLASGATQLLLASQMVSVVLPLRSSL
jgi:SAM-dependent methyltransferase